MNFNEKEIFQSAKPKVSKVIAPYDETTLFIHVPKTGGTTLASILQDHYYAAPQLPHAAPTDLGKYISELNDPVYPYIGGHYPLATINFERFDNRITILRDPVDVISSAISFVQKVRNLPEGTLLESEIKGDPVFNFKIFFSTHFDIERYKLEFNQSIAEPFSSYLSDCTITEALEGLNKFTHIFDFSVLDTEIKRFLIEKNFFPYFQISKKRQYSYQPDYARAKRSLSEFDANFYQLGKNLFKKIPENIDLQYEHYRENYCKDRGLALQVYEGKMLDLRGPIGSGWHTVEQSTDGISFRWSEPKSATLEIPIAFSGTYAVILFINPAEVTGLQVKVKTILHSRSFETRLVHDAGMLLCQFFVDTRSHDWIHISIEMQNELVDSACISNGDLRELGIALNGVSVCRQP